MQSNEREFSRLLPHPRFIVVFPASRARGKRKSYWYIYEGGMKYQRRFIEFTALYASVLAPNHISLVKSDPVATMDKFASMIG